MNYKVSLNCYFDWRSSSFRLCQGEMDFLFPRGKSFGAGFFAKGMGVCRNSSTGARMSQRDACGTTRASYFIVLVQVINLYQKTIREK